MNSNSLDKRRVRLHFERHAHEYDRYAAVQKEMAERLAERVVRELGRAGPRGETPRPGGGPAGGVRRVLELGCGTGRLSERMLRAFPEAELTALDLSPAMLEAARRRLGADAGRVRWIEADAERWVEAAADAGRRFDLIVSSAALQWFADPAGVVRGMARLLAPQGRLAFATFGPDTFRELHRAFAVAESELGLPARRRGLHFPDAAAWRRMIEVPRSAGDPAPALAAVCLEEEHRIETYPDVREFLRHVQRVGAGSADPEAAFLGRPLLRAMERHYREAAGTDEGIPATYHVLYVLCGSV